MTFDELKKFYGSYIAEMVSQAMTLAEFRETAMEDLVEIFRQRAEQARREYQFRRNNPPANDRESSVLENYLAILLRRWQKAEELAGWVYEADKKAQSRTRQRR